MTRILRYLKFVSILLSIAPTRVRQEHSIRAPKPMDVMCALIGDIRVARGVYRVYDTSERLQSRMQSVPSTCSDPPFLRSTLDITPDNPALSHPEVLVQATRCCSTPSRSALADLRRRAGTSGDSSSDTFARGARKVPLNSYSYVI